MDQNSPFFKGGTTLLDPVSLAFTLALGASLLVVKRRWVLLPLCLTICFVPMQQRIVIAGLDFDMGRVMILFGWARILVRGELHRITPTPLDRWFVTWLVAGTLFYFLGDPRTSSLVYRAGLLLDAFGMFFLCRLVVRDAADVSTAITILCWIALAIAPFMAFESFTGFNPFSFLGGVEPWSMVREGRVRASGSLTHPIMAGTFGATLFPLAVALWRAQPQRRAAAIGGMIGSVGVTLFAASSGPVIALGMAILGWSLWFVRDWMRAVRWGTVAVLLVLHFVREAPVWHLIGRVSDLIGGTGWHRYALIDAAIYYWRDWFLVGMGTRSTGSWGFGLEDVTNQFVAEGVKGGIVTLACFVALLVAGFVGVSRTLTRVARAQGVPAPRRQGAALIAWGLGVALAAHCTSWISVSYFGQMWVFLYLHLALIAVLVTDPAFARRQASVPVVAMAGTGDALPDREAEEGGAAPALGRQLLGSRRARLAATRPGTPHGGVPR